MIVVDTSTGMVTKTQGKLMSRTRVREAHVIEFFSHSKEIQECGEVFDEKDSNFSQRQKLMELKELGFKKNLALNGSVTCELFECG